MPLSSYVSTYQHDFSGRGGDRLSRRHRSKSFTALPLHKPSTGRIPTSGRPMTNQVLNQGLMSDSPICLPLFKELRNL